MATQTKQFIKECKKIMGNRVYDDYLRRFAYGVDASCYRYIPQVVLKPKNEEEICAIFALSSRFNMPLTFRAAGTSLSGQACGGGALVLANSLWQDIEVLDSSIKCGCGVIGSAANEAIKHLHKKIGPDPATLNNAMIGGIFSNNSSGMCCGVKQNSYHTVKSMRVILHDGFVLDTSDEGSIAEFKATHSAMIRAILDLRAEILADSALQELISRKFAIKNTTGYSLNALLDFSDIIDILNHLFIGAEGTLGFVSRVEYEMVEDYAFKACALIFYENLALSAKAVEILGENEKIVSAAEIMDYACLDCVRGLEGVPQELQYCKEGNCAILVQLESNDKNDLNAKINAIESALMPIPTLFPLRFSFDKIKQDSWWKIRKGLLPLSAATRPSGSTVITEDICFEMKYFALGISRITELFSQYHFQGIIFGHALSGNVHFIITPRLDDEEECARFAGFMDSLIEVVVELKGSSKAEHGTGRMIAPFVEKEWGAKAYSLNRRIKGIFDKSNLINPDVMICEDKEIHLKNLKPAYEIQSFITKCMECGFCEKVCPSRDLTLTPRQRIATYREAQRLANAKNLNKEDKLLLKSLQKGYRYFGIETCATCSMCANLCPLEIDTAKIALSLKPQLTSRFAKAVVGLIARHFAGVMIVIKLALKVANFIGKIIGFERLSRLSSVGHKAFGLPFVPRSLSNANDFAFTKTTDSVKADSRVVMYFSSCINRAFKPQNPQTRPMQAVFEDLCKKAGVSVRYPREMEKFCCGKAFKDYPHTAKQKVIELQNALLNEARMLGVNELAVVCDHSACSYELFSTLNDLESTAIKSTAIKPAHIESTPRIRFYDMPQFLETLLPQLQITPLKEDIALYAMCAVKKGKWENSLTNIAKACTSGKVVIHHATQCCGFAGNKGFITPELNTSSLRGLVRFYESNPIARGYASSSTCEMGLNHHSQTQWQNLLYLLEECAL